MWNEIKRGVPQGFILGDLLFKISDNDIFMFIEKSEICNFADDNIIYRQNAKYLQFDWLKQRAYFWYF